MEILSLGEKIKRKRKELKMTLKDLAKDRITPGQISLVESGRSNPSMDLLEYLANSLNTTVEYLMESEESQAEKICTYYEQLAESYIISGEYEKSETYIDEALKYTEKYNLEYKKARCYFLRAEINMKREEFATAQQLLMSANVIFIKNNKYEEIIKSFLNLAKITLHLKAYHSASSYLKQADKVYTDNNIGNDFLLGEIYYNMAKVSFTIEQVEESKKYANLAKDKFNEIQNKKQYASSLISLSDEYNRKDDSVNAIKYSTKALEVYKEIEKSNTISSIENTLGKLFYDFNEVDEAFKHFELSKEIRVRNNDTELVDTLINLCKNYIKIKDLPKCKETLEEIDLRLDRNNIKSIIEVNLLKHRVLTIEEKLEEAKDVLVSTYNMAKEFNLNEEASNLAIAIAKFYLDKKEDDLAKKYLDEGVEIFRKMGILQN
ncbi:MAG: helix-turn-helix transcriptional regulator [Clostridium sp.]|nr:helix-turn-helix transcriptional regulator [Clostridium sp.]